MFNVKFKYPLTDYIFMREEKINKIWIKKLKEVGVFLITLALIFSTVVTAETINDKTNPEFLIATGPDFSIENSPIKNGPIMFEQLPFEPDEEWIFRISASDSGYRVWDEYWDIQDQYFCHLHFWGLCVMDPWTFCDPEAMVFEIIFWDALLGNPICTYEFTPHARPTGKFYNGSELFYWKVDLDPCCDCVPDGWVSIQSIQSPFECWFLWAGSGDGDLYCYQEGATNPDGDSDCAFQLAMCDCETPTKIVCDSVGMNFGKVGPNATVTGQIYVCNEGLEGSYMEWYVDTVHVPKWGTWTFSPASGTGVAKGDCDIIDVTCVLTNATGSYNGTIIIYNAGDDPDDFCEIYTSVEITKARSYKKVIWNIFSQFPVLKKFLGISIAPVALGIQNKIAKTFISDEYEEIITYIEGNAGLNWIVRRGLLRGEVNIIEWEDMGFIKLSGFRRSDSGTEFYFEVVDFVHANRFIGWEDVDWYPLGYPIVFGIAIGNIEWR